MDLPDSPVTKNKCTQAELEYLLGDMNVADRQDTIEEIHEIASSAKITDGADSWLYKLENIKGLCEEFC